jgi:hypothetical protein
MKQFSDDFLKYCEKTIIICNISKECKGDPNSIKDPDKFNILIDETNEHFSKMNDVEKTYAGLVLMYKFKEDGIELSDDEKSQLHHPDIDIFFIKNVYNKIHEKLSDPNNKTEIIME